MKWQLICTSVSVAALVAAGPVAAQDSLGAPGEAVPDPTTDQAAQSGVTESAVAADQVATEVGEIVITAQRRSESLQKVPLAVTALTGDDLARSNINDLAGITARVPNLNLGQQLGVAKIALRGIGLENISAGAEGSIAFHVDGVFVSRSIAALSSFYDVEQVEVLRGPQGTLYGRNATGGSINLTTRNPTRDLSGYFNLTLGNYDRVVAEGAVSGPIVSDVLAARIAFQVQQRDGYGTNIITGRDIDDQRTKAVRGSLRFTPGDRLTIDVKGDYFKERDRAGGYHFLGNGGFSAPGVPIISTGLVLGGVVADNPRDIASLADPSNNLEFYGVSGKISYEISPTVDVSSLTSYRRTKYLAVSDLDATSFRLSEPQVQFENAKQFSQEFQLSGNTDRLNWLVGLYYLNEKTEGRQETPFNNLVVGFPLPGTFVQGYYGGGRIETDAYAAFGQASYEIIDNLTLTLGARYSTEKKINNDEQAFDVLTPYDRDTLPIPQTLNRSKRFDSFTPRVAIDYQATPDILAYVSYSKGFKAGTYNLGGLQPPVDSEKVDAFEGGVKSQLFDRRLRLNLAGFYYDYKDLQVGKVIGNQLALENAATATIYGLEAEATLAVTDQFQLDANGSWLNARFDEYVSADPARPFGDGRTFIDAAGNLVPAGTAGAQPAFNLAGNALSQSPDFTAFAGAQYTLATGAGDFTLRGEASYRDRVFFTPFNVDYVSQEAFTKYNAFLNWRSPDGALNGSVFVKNLTNELTIANSLVSSGLFGFPINGFIDEPRTYGVRLGFKF